MMSVIDDYNIMPAIFIVIRDNVSLNTIMLLEYKRLALIALTSLKQPWAFIAKAGDVCYIRHIINVAI
jgi:hypothetical protein